MDKDLMSFIFTCLQMLKTKEILGFFFFGQIS